MGRICQQCSRNTPRAEHTEMLLDRLSILLRHTCRLSPYSYSERGRRIVKYLYYRIRS